MCVYSRGRVAPPREAPGAEGGKRDMFGPTAAARMRAIFGFKHELGCFPSCLPLRNAGGSTLPSPLPGRGTGKRTCPAGGGGPAVGAHGAYGTLHPLVPPAACPAQGGERAAAGSQRRQLPAGRGCRECPPRPPGCGVRRCRARVPALSTSSAKSILSLEVLTALGLGLQVLFE